MLTKLLCLGVLALGATAQDVPLEIKYNLTGFTYPRIARLAHVQGVVRLELIPKGADQEVKVVVVPPLLVQQVRENLAKWRTNRPVIVNYNFKLIPVEIIKSKMPRGDAFDRFLLRVFHLATYTEQSRCQESSVKPSTSEPKLSQQSPLILEVETVATQRCANVD